MPRGARAGQRWGFTGWCAATRAKSPRYRRRGPQPVTLQGSGQPQLDTSGREPYSNAARVPKVSGVTSGCFPPATSPRDRSCRSTGRARSLTGISPPNPPPGRCTPSAGTGKPGLSSALPQLRSGVSDRSRAGRGAPAGPGYAPAAPGLHAAWPPGDAAPRPPAASGSRLCRPYRPRCSGGTARTGGLLPEKRGPRAINMHFKITAKNLFLPFQMLAAVFQHPLTCNFQPRSVPGERSIML